MRDLGRQGMPLGELVDEACVMSGGVSLAVHTNGQGIDRFQLLQILGGGELSDDAAFILIRDDRRERLKSIAIYLHGDRCYLRSEVALPEVLRTMIFWYSLKDDRFDGWRQAEDDQY